MFLTQTDIILFFFAQCINKFEVALFKFIENF